MNELPQERDGQFATDLDRGAAKDAPDRHADSLAVHGFLSLLRPGEAAETDRRVDRAMATIRAQARHIGVLGRIDLRRVAAFSSLAALVALAIYLIPGTADSQAYAALQSVVRAGRASSNRVYQLTMERGTENTARSSRATLELGEGGRYVLNMNSHAMSPQALAMALMGGVAQPPLGHRDGTRGGHFPEGGKTRGDGLRGDGSRGDGLRGDGHRGDGTHSDGPRGRIDSGAWGRHLPVFGFDGESHWVIGPDGRTRQRPPSPTPDIETRGEDADPEFLMLGPILERLERGYEVRLVPPGLDSQPGALVVEAGVKGDATNRRMPSRVRVIADSKTYEIRSLDAMWESPTMSGHLRRLQIDLLGPSQRGIEYFSPESHEPASDDEAPDQGTL